MAVGQVIGRVSVKVMPDTKEFRRDAERQLSKVEKSIVVSIPTKLDMTGAMKDLLTEVRRINQDNRAKDSRKVKFYARMDNSGMDAEISKAVRTLTSKAMNQKVKFNADVSAVMVEGRLDPNQMKKLKQDLLDWRDDVSPLKVMVHPEMVVGATGWINKRLDYLSRPRAVPIAPFLVPGATTKVATALAALSGARVLSTMFEDMWKSLKNLDKSVPIIGTLAYAVQGLGAFALAGASNLFALSSSLAQIGPAALALPGIFGGIAIGLGATFAVLKDFNKVLPEVKGQLADLQDRMSANFWSVAEGPIRNLIDSLLPQFSDGLAKVSTELGGFFGKFSTALVDQFDGALAGMFADLSESIAIASAHTDSFATILRVLGEVGAGYLPQLAGWFGDLSDRFAGFLEQAQGDGSLVGWIDRGIFQLQELGRATAELGGVFYGLATAAEAAGGSTLTMLADSLDHMNKVVNGPAFQGALTKTLIAAHDAMRLISDQAGPAFTDFMLAMSTTSQGTMRIAGDAIGGLFKALFEALGDPTVQNGFSAMISGISQGISGLLPAIAPLGEVFGTLMRVIGVLAANLGPVLGAAFSGLAGPVSTIGKALIPIINMLGPILTQAITALAPLFQAIAVKFAEVAVAAQPLIQRIGELIQWLMPVLVPALTFVAQVIGNALIGAINGAIQVFDGIKTAVGGFITVFQGIIQFLSGDFSGGLSTIWSGVKAIFTGAFNAIVGAIKVWLNVGILAFVKGGITKLIGFWKGGWSSVQQIVNGVWNAIKGLIVSAWNAIKTNVTGALNGVKAIFQSGWQAFVGIIKTVWGLITGSITAAWNGIKAFVTGALGVLKGVWTTGWNVLVGVLKAAWSLFKGAIKSGWEAAFAIVKAIPGKIKGVFSGAGTMLVTIGENIVQGLANGIEAAKAWLVEKVQSIADIIPGWLKKKLGIKSPSRVTKQIGKYVGQGLALGIAGTQGEVNEKMAVLMGMVQKTMNKKAKAIVETAHNALRPLAEQFENLGTKIDTAKDDWEQLKEAAQEYAKAVKQAIIATGDLTKVEGLKNEETGEQMAVTFGDMRTHLQKAVAEAREFNQLWTALRDMGLNDTGLEQFMDAGPAALEQMRAIFSAPIGSVAEINALQEELAKIGGNIANKAKDQFHQAGIDTAKGFLDGLIQDREKVAEAMRSIAAEMVVALKAELGIHSPSRVFKALGGHVVTGLAKGLGDTGLVGGVMTSLASDMADSGRSMVDSLIDGMESRYGALQASLEGATSDLGLNVPETGSNVSTSVGAALATDGNGVVVDQKVLNYYAAPGSSLGSEEDLFAAAGRGRMVGW